MKNSFGNSVSITLFGESHGKAIGAVLDGFAPGIEVDEAFIAAQMAKRQGIASISTKRREADRVEILSGVFQGKTTGTPICFLIHNEAQRSADYESEQRLARPSHADYTAMCKYHGFEDYRGGGHFSGRLTAPLVAAGALAIKALEKKEILIATHIAECAGVEDRQFCIFKEDFNALKHAPLAVLESSAKEKMLAAVEVAAAQGDSVGGVLETVVSGLPGGVGEPFFDSLESLLSHAMFSIPAVKGIEFGSGFELAKLTGSAANDALECKNGKIVSLTNHNGGINGGITNGMPVLFKTAIKPTPSIFKPQQTIDLKTGKAATLTIHGRHDPAIVHRAAVVQDSLTALTLCDLLAMRFGTDYLGENIKIREI